VKISNSGCCRERRLRVRWRFALAVHIILVVVFCSAVSGPRALADVDPVITSMEIEGESVSHGGTIDVGLSIAMDDWFSARVAAVNAGNIVSPGGPEEGYNGITISFSEYQSSYHKELVYLKSVDSDCTYVEKCAEYGGPEGPGGYYDSLLVETTDKVGWDAFSNEVNWLSVWFEPTYYGVHTLYIRAGMSDREDWDVQYWERDPPLNCGYPLDCTSLPAYKVYAHVRPRVPSSVEASTSNPAYVEIEWGSIPDSGAEYHVYRSATSGGYKTPLGDWQSGTAMHDEPPSRDTYYYYWVKSRVGAVESLYSSSDQGRQPSAPSPELGSHVISKPSVSVNESFTITVDGKNAGGSTAAYGGIAVQVREAFDDGVEVEEDHLASGADDVQSVWWDGDLLGTDDYADYLHVEPTWSSWTAGSTKTLQVTITPKKVGTYTIYTKMYLYDGVEHPRDPPGSTPYTDHQGEATEYVGSVTVLPSEPCVELTLHRVSETTGGSGPNTSDPGTPKTVFRPGETVRMTLKAENHGSAEDIEVVCNFRDHAAPGIDYVCYDSDIPQKTSSGARENVVISLAQGEIKYCSFDYALPDWAIASSYDVIGSARAFDNWDDVLDTTAPGSCYEDWDNAWLNGQFSVEAESVDIPILMYHKIDDPPSPDCWEYWVEPEMLTKQLAALKAYGYATVSLGEVLAYRSGTIPPEKPIVLTFDDSYLNHFTNVLPILQAEGYAGVFGIITGKTASTDSGRLDNSWDIGEAGCPAYHMIWAEVDTLEASGMELASHSVTHPHLTDPALNQDDITMELRNSKASLEARPGNPDCNGFVYPYGDGAGIGGEDTDRVDLIQEILRDEGYRWAVAAGDGETNVGSDNPFALERICIPGNCSVDIDPSGQSPFFMTLVDSDFLLPKITDIESIQFLDCQGQDSSTFSRGETVTIRVTAVNVGDVVDVIGSLELDHDTSLQTVSAYDSHPAAEDVAISDFDSATRTFEYSWTIADDAELGQYYYDFGVHDEHYVLGFFYSGWCEAFRIMGSTIPPDWGSGTSLGQYALFGQSYDVLSFLDSERIAVVHAGSDQIEVDPAVLAAVLLHHSFETTRPAMDPPGGSASTTGHRCDLALTSGTAIAAAAAFWKDQADALNADLAGVELTEAQEELVGECRKGIGIKSVGLVAGITAGAIIGTCCGGPIGTVVGAIAAGCSIIAWGYGVSSDVVELHSDVVGDQFLVDEHAAYFRAIALLEGQEVAMDLFENFSMREGVADQWDQAGKTFADISMGIGIAGSVSTLFGSVDSLWYGVEGLAELGYRFFIEDPVLDHIKWHMDIDAIKYRLEFMRNTHLTMEYNLASDLAHFYSDLLVSRQSLSLAESYGRGMVAIATYQKHFLEIRNEVAYSQYVRANTWVDLGGVQAAYEYFPEGLAAVFDRWEAEYGAYDWFVTWTQDAEILSSSLFGAAQVSYDEIGGGLQSDLDVWLSNELSPLDVPLGIQSDTPISVANMSDAELLNVRVALLNPEVSPVQFDPIQIASIAAGVSAAIDLQISCPSDATQDGFIVAPFISITYTKGGQELQRLTRLRCRLVLPYVVQDVEPSQILPMPGDSVLFDSYVLSQVSTIVTITPRIEFRDSSRYTNALPSQNLALSAGERSAFSLSWTASDYPKGDYTLVIEVSMTDLSLEFRFPRIVVVLPSVVGNLDAFIFSEIVIVSPTADDEIARRLQAALSVPASSFYCVDQTTPVGVIAELKTNENLLLIGGHMANPLVEDLVEDGRLPSDLWSRSGDATIHVIENPFPLENPSGGTAVVVAGWEVDDTYCAGLGFIKAFYEQPEYSIPFVVSHWVSAGLDPSDSDEIDLDQILQAIAWWANVAVVPLTRGQTIDSEQEILSLVASWADATEFTEPLSEFAVMHWVPAALQSMPEPVRLTRLLEATEITPGGRVEVRVDVRAAPGVAGILLSEVVPEGWNIVPVSGSGAAFNSTAQKWLWLTVGSETRSLRYWLEAPRDLTVGTTIHLEGEALVAAPEGVVHVSGDDSLTVTKGDGLEVREVLWRPNPLRGGDTAVFDVLGGGIASIQLRVYNLSGHLIYDSGLLAAASVEWDGRFSRGEFAANGVYLCLLTVRGVDESVYRHEIVKLVILR